MKLPSTRQSSIVLIRVRKNYYDTFGRVPSIWIGYLQKMYEAALKGHSLQENSEQRQEDDKAEVSAVPGMTPKQRELNAISRAEKAVMSVKRFKDIIDDPKHLLAMAKRRVTLAYRRVQMAMHELENATLKCPREALLMMVSPRRQLQVISLFPRATRLLTSKGK